MGHNATQTMHNATTGLSGAGSVHGAAAAPAMPAASAAPDMATAAHSAPAAGDAAVQAMGTAAQAAGAPMESAFSWGGYFQAIGVLLLLLALLWGVVWVVRKYGKFNFLPQPGSLPRDALRLETQLPLGQRRGLVVVRFLNKRLLLGVTDHQITLLQEAESHHEHDSLDFQKIMEQEQRRKADV